jgi:7-cyano-7-deazaguanine synthase in queuosine biosynthesis
MPQRRTDAVNRFRFPAGPSDQALTRAPWASAPWQRLSTYEAIADPAEPPGAWARDLLMLVNAAYVSDRLASYPDAAHWHREIHIDVPLTTPGIWRGRPLKLLETILGYLSGDLWRIDVREGTVFHPITQQQFGERWRATELTLFSGGLDSTAGAAQIAARPGDPALLVSYHHQATDNQQAGLLAQLKKQVAKRDLHRVSVESGLERDTGHSEHSQHRTRGLRFIGTGVYLAAAHGVRELAVPENGQLAVNPPLTAARAGAWSTRSVHPTVLRLINELIDAVGGTVRATNPLMDLTKGEVCSLALQCGLTETDLMLTNSCSKPASNLDGATHCGACFACLVRRSGLLAAGIPDTTAYRHTFRDNPINRLLEENLHALSMWLASDFTRADLAVDLPLPTGLAAQILPVIERGRDELAALVELANGERRPL